MRRTTTRRPRKLPTTNIARSPKNAALTTTTKPKDAFIRICAGPNDKEAKRINWYSAKHHVLTMHYCLEAAHNKLAAARQWASGSDRDAAKESDDPQGRKGDQRSI